MGSDPIAVPALQALLALPGVDLRAVYAQPDRRRGRGMKVQDNPVKHAAMEAGLPVRQPEKPGAEEVEWLRAEGIELIIVMAYGHLLPKALLDVPERGIYNLHASLLPAYRGASPVETALACGETETGVSFMRLVPKMDAGPVADAERVPITSEDDAPVLRARLAAGCVPLLRRVIPQVLKGTATFEEQDETAVTYCRLLGKADGYLDFTAPACELAARVRAFAHWPRCVFPCEDGEIKLGFARCEESLSAEAPGTVVRADRHGVAVATGEGTVVFTQLQRPGARMLPAGDFLNGCPLAPGTVLASRAMLPLVQKAKPFARDFHRQEA